MKHCPKCSFSFADFHHVCDFDGAPLVPDPLRPSLVTASPRLSSVRLTLMSPFLLAPLAATALLFSALLIGYYDSPGEAKPLVKDQPAPTSPVTTNTVARASEQSPAVINSPAAWAGKSIRDSNRLAVASSKPVRRPPTASRSLAQRDQTTTHVNRSRKTEVARGKGSLESSGKKEAKLNPTWKTETAAQRDSKQTPREKDPKLVAMLKTTWRVLKKPFKF